MVHAAGTPLRLLAAVVVAAAVAGGLWVSGALVTDDFAVAMALSAAWMAVTGLVAAAIAWRSRSLRWPVLGAYVLTAVAIGAYLAPSQLLDDEVGERVATGPARAAGAFVPGAHEARGTARVVGGHLTLTGFEVDNGPDLRVYLVAGPAASEDDVRDVVDLGALKGNKGDQQYRIPAGTAVARHATVVIWCRAFSVLFARAPLRA